MTRAFGIDISKWQSSADGKRKMDFDAVTKHKEPVSFIAARAGIADDYEDSMFQYYWKEMKRIRSNRIAYHVLYFGINAVAQMDNLFGILKGKVDWNHDRIALDLEITDISQRGQYTQTTLDCLEICKQRTGRYPIAYSRAGWVNSHLNINDLPELDWWLAYYLRPNEYPDYTPEHPGPPLLPNGVSQYLIHQTSEKGKSIGAIGHYMDYNRWNGDENSVAAYFGGPGSVAQDEDTEIPDVTAQNQGLFQAQCMVFILFTRTGPSNTMPIIGRLRLGDVVTVFEEKDGWFRVHDKDSIWVQGKRFLMRRIAQHGAKISPLFVARVIVPAQYIRVGPGKEHPVMGNLVKNQLVEVFEERNGWFRIAPGAEVWVHGGAQYLQRVH
ncbi:MAG TPA: GH25 family lysozyme [Anaerolineaceae bacterium]|nr:GH25 family lysozyme [Anaerolineaceae bacterium]